MGSVEASLAPGAPVQDAATARLTAQEAATSMLRAWARNDATPTRWWQQLGPYLSAQGRQDYAHTDPAAIPDVAVSRRARLVEQAHSMWAKVTVPTTRGRFTVELTRPTPTAAWLVDLLDFPPQMSGPAR